MRVWAGFLFAAASILLPAHGGDWHVTKDHWSQADEIGFSRFVTAIGESGCSSSQSCLRDPANPYRATDRRFLDIDTDCAKWPYLLRAYYAWKNGLPFSYVDQIVSRGDERHGAGNRPSGRHAFIDRGTGIDGPAAVRSVIDTVSTANYRMDAGADGAVLSDFYAPRIASGVIRPGTVLYDTHAHAGIVYKVDDDGRVYYMDAHPDFTITRSVYGPQFGESPAKLGGGLKNWRPQTLIGARKDGEGHLTGGRIVLARNDAIADFSLEQYQGSGGGAKLRFVYDGEAIGLYGYIRTVLSGGKTRFNPLHELRISLKGLCSDLKDRAAAVNLAISQKIADEPHPSRLPTNIYDSDDGDWEQYATPARDSRLRAGFAELYRSMGRLAALWQARDPRLVYDGNDLQADLLALYDGEVGDCDLTYLSSAKQPVKLTLADIPARLYGLSFDPYDCIELRWGGVERQSCTNGGKKNRWYAAEQVLRDRGERQTRTAYSLDELEALPASARAPVDVRALIAAMPARPPLPPMQPVGR